MTSPQIRSLVRRLDTLERQILQRKLPTLGFSAIDDGSIASVDVDGKLQMIIGKQFDQTQAPAVVAGPTPPTPTTPLVTQTPGGARVYWDGTFENAALTPMDFSRVTVHVTGDLAGFNPAHPATIVGEINTATGGEVTASLDAGERLVVLVCWSLSGKPSAYSAPQSIAPGPVEVTSDGNPPVPPTGWALTLAPLGIMALQASWPAVPNSDALTYDVYLAAVDPATGAGLADPPPSSAKYASTGSTSMTFSRLPDGTPLNKDTTYAARVVARDVDGSSAASIEGRSPVRQADATSISSDYAYLGDVEARQLKSGTVESTLAILGSIITQATGRNVSLSSEDGLRAQDQNGDTLFHVPTDSNLNLKMLLDAILLSATVTGPLAMRSDSNELAQNAVLILRSGTSAPVTPPTVKTVWTEKRASATDDNASWRQGGHVDSGVAYQAWRTWGYSGIDFYDPASGVKTGGFGLPSNYNANGVVRLGTKLYVLGWDTDRYKNNNPWSPRWFLWRYALDGTLEDEGEVYASVDFANNNAPIIGVTGSSILLALPKASTNQIILNIMDPATLGQTSSGALNYNIGSTQLAGIARGTFDFGADRYVVSTKDRTGGDLILVFDPATANEVTNDEWPGAKADSLAGIMWDSVAGRFKQFSRTRDVLYTYDGLNWSGASTKNITVASTWYDSDPVGGEHETTYGPTALVAMKKRASLQVTTPPIPSDANVDNHDDANAVRIYMSQAGASIANLYRQASPANGVITATVDRPVFSNADTNHPNPPAVGNFPAATPAVIRSEDGTSYMDGNGKLVVKRLTETTPKPHANVSKTNAQTLTSGSWQTIVFNASTLRGGTTYDTVTNPGTITVPEDGVYQIDASIAFAANATGYRGIAVLAGGAATHYGYMPPSSASIGMPKVSFSQWLAAGSTIVVQGRQQSGADLALDVTNGFNYVTVTKIGD